jgi:LmbE family N-acetylglucosaminyl deacetylase
MNRSVSPTPSPPEPVPVRSALLAPERTPLSSAETVATLGTVLVAAPHPDDESLGCGGLLALLAARGLAPHAVFVTDGAQSHPNSAAYPPARLRAVREQEARGALSALGIAPDHAHFLRYPDCGLPRPGTPAFAAAAEHVAHLLRTLQPDTLLVAWRRDPHCDHEGAWHLFRAARQQLHLVHRPRWIEYPVWAWAHPNTDHAPRTDEGEQWRLDVSSVLGQKRAAIHAHRSQLGLITDDPDGFTLPRSFLPLFLRPWEWFIEPTDLDA